MSAALPTLLTFAPMVDSELSRLVLAYHGTRYRERDHLFGWVSLLTLLRGGYGRVPLLHGAGFRTTGPLRIAARLDAAVAEERRLVPTGEPMASPVTADVSHFNGQFALDVATFAYFHLLPERALMTPIFAAPVSPREGRIMPHVYVPTRLLFRLLLRLTPARADAARVRIGETFANLDRRLAGGREYLVGDRLTLADLAVMASAAPILLPEGYHALPLASDQLPQPLRGLRHDLLGTTTSDYVNRRYGELRASGR